MTWKLRKTETFSSVVSQRWRFHNKTGGRRSKEFHCTFAATRSELLSCFIFQEISGNPAEHLLLLFPDLWDSRVNQMSSWASTHVAVGFGNLSLSAVCNTPLMLSGRNLDRGRLCGWYGRDSVMCLRTDSCRYQGLNEASVLNERIRAG